ncbi:MAG: alpha/beta fold hydrolase [Polyangiaceae bacterium]|nr:alpha/beta fold hydrolase [Polyangiaceae bacterium]MCW5792069.1 alpha/beta fold hydrolase [Polyangiaceae bacterium]
MSELKVETGRVQVGDVSIAYDTRGAGEPVLLIPGLSMRRVFWPEELCDLLARAGHTVVRIDNRDAGDSSRIKAPPSNPLRLMGRALLGLPTEAPYGLEHMAEDALGLMSALGHERFHVAGASMGGMIGQLLALNAQDRILSLTSVMSSPGGRRYSVSSPPALRALFTPLPVGRAERIEHYVRTFRMLAGKLPFDESAARALATLQVDGGTSPAASARHLAAVIRSSPGRRQRLPAITTPTLVIHGDADPLLPLRGARAMARLVPHAELLIVPGMGHNFPAESLPLLAGAIATHARKAGLSKPPEVSAAFARLDLPRAARALRALLNDPDDLPQVFNLIDALTSERQYTRLHARFRQSRAGQRLLREQPDITRLLADREWLRCLPEGSLGRAYLAFVEREQISSQGIREASSAGRPEAKLEGELRFMSDRMRDTHDLWHAAVGYQGDVLGELGLLAFTYAQVQNKAVGLIVLAGLLKGWGEQVGRVVWEGYRRGRRASFLPAQPWEELLDSPLTEVRLRLGLEAPPSYVPVRTAELRAQGVLSGAPAARGASRPSSQAVP